MAVPTIEQVSQNINGVTVQCAHVVAPTDSVFLMKDVLDTIGSGNFILQTVARAAAAATITVTIGTAAASLALTTSFTRYIQQYTEIDPQAGRDMTIEFPAGEYWLYHTMLEHGNRASDWRVSPEDTQEQIAQIYTEIFDSYTRSYNDAQQLVNEAVSSYTRLSDFESYRAQVDTQFVQTSESFDFVFNTITEQISELNGETAAEFTELHKYIRFQDGNIILGEANSPLILSLQNDRISFLNALNEVAYMSDNKMYISNVEVTESAIITGLVFTETENGYRIDIKG